MRSVLILGENSFIGGALERRLAAFVGRYRVRALGMHGEAWQAFDFSGFDCAVHVAGIAHVSPKPQMTPLYEAVNRDLALACARRCKQAGVRQFIFLSSANVFGQAACAGQERLIAPDTPPAPANAYGRTKLEAEQGLRALEDEHFRVAVLRPMMVFGAGCRGNYRLLSALARRAFIFPAFGGLRGAVYIEDLAELMRRIIDAGAGGTYHPQTLAATAAQFACAVAAAHGRRLRLTRAFNPLLRLLGRRGVLRRAFGGFCYRADMAARGDADGAPDLLMCVQRTEDVHG